MQNCEILLSSKNIDLIKRKWFGPRKRATAASSSLAPPPEQSWPIMHLHDVQPFRCNNNKRHAFKSIIIIYIIDYKNAISDSLIHP